MDPDNLNKKRFFILWNPESPHPPIVTFKTLKEATVVAEKMTVYHHGAPFYVMGAKIGGWLTKAALALCKVTYQRYPLDYAAMNAEVLAFAVSHVTGTGKGNA